MKSTPDLVIFFGQADTLTTRDTVRSRVSSEMDENCRVEMTDFKSRHRSRQRHCDVADDDDFEDEESGREEEEEGPLIR